MAKDDSQKILQALENLTKGQKELVSRADKTDELLDKLNSRADNSEKMIRTVISGQSSLKAELLTEIKKVEQKVDKVVGKVDRLDVKLTKRIDKLGLQIAELEDDAPTIEEFEKLEKKVSSLQKSAVSA